MAFPIQVTREAGIYTTTATIEESGRVEVVIKLTNSGRLEVTGAVAIWFFDKDGNILAVYRKDGLSVAGTGALLGGPATTKWVNWLFALLPTDVRRLASAMILYDPGAVDDHSLTRTELEKIRAQARCTAKSETKGLPVFDLPCPTTDEVFAWCEAKTSSDAISCAMFDFLLARYGFLSAIYEAFGSLPEARQDATYDGIRRLRPKFAQALANATRFMWWKELATWIGGLALCGSFAGIGFYAGFTEHESWPCALLAVFPAGLFLAFAYYFAGHLKAARKFHTVGKRLS
ncbi:MAG: hypothetical protein ABFD90_14155 [Phycisphaerales bacterium]